MLLVFINGVFVNILILRFLIIKFLNENFWFVWVNDR